MSPPSQSPPSSSSARKIRLMDGGTNFSDNDHDDDHDDENEDDDDDDEDDDEEDKDENVEDNDDDEKNDENEKRQEKDLIIASSSNVLYSWDHLRLGQSLGTGALNAFLEEKRQSLRHHIHHHPTASQLSPRHVLDILNSIRLKTILPPPGSVLHGRMMNTNTTTMAPPVRRKQQQQKRPRRQRPRHEETSKDRKSQPKARRLDHRDHDHHNDKDGDEKRGGDDGNSEDIIPHEWKREGLPPTPTPPIPRRPGPDEDEDDLDDSDNTSGATDNSGAGTTVVPPYPMLSHLYEFMCRQEVDDGSSNRREIQFLTASGILDKLQSLENDAAELKLREDHILQRGKELGLQ